MTIPQIGAKYDGQFQAKLSNFTSTSTISMCLLTLKVPVETVLDTVGYSMHKGVMDAQGIKSSRGFRRERGYQHCMSHVCIHGG